MNIALVGLGLIGGSIAKTIKLNTNNTLYGYDISKTVLEKALCEKSIESISDDYSIMDIIIISLYPQDTVAFLENNIDNFKAGSITIDCCGVKEFICNEAENIFRGSDAVFIGGHPMAGREFSGYDHSKNDLFINASMIFTPISTTPDWAVEKASKLFEDIKFKSISVTTPKHHDQVIAYTSQLAHVVSSAYMQSPTADDFRGFSAGSFNDLTRVAKLNPEMWSELFLKNKNALVYEIELIVNALEKFKYFIENDKKDELKNILKQGSTIKERLTEERK